MLQGHSGFTKQIKFILSSEFSNLLLDGFYYEVHGLVSTADSSGADTHQVIGRSKIAIGVLWRRPNSGIERLLRDMLVAC